ncbi:hypothetical protein [Pseudomonas sp. Irchel 3E13]|uniref:hypothetical protein n=1 Tax=Pseudomonas sp. Irchel 3E13 TaxID=2008975 RepID=UPI000BA2EAF0|nr:hypothetical protein [Pseudomonas sp. Irchel 3E13]
MKNAPSSNPQVLGLGIRVLLHLVIAAIVYATVAGLLPTALLHHGVQWPAKAIRGFGIAVSFIWGLYALAVALLWLWRKASNVVTALQRDPRENLRTLPPLKGELTDLQKNELLVLTKTSTSWGGLEAELKARGFRLVPHSHDLCLATLNSTIEVLCTMSSLGYGASYESLCKRCGAPPEHLVPLRRAM